MKRAVLLLVLTISSLSFSQKDMTKITKGSFSSWSSIYSYTDYQLQTILHEKDKLKKNKVKSRTITSYSGGKQYKSLQNFDTEGRIIEIKRTNKTKVNTINYTYDTNGNIIKILTTNPKQQHWPSVFKYDDKGRLIERESYNYKGEYNGIKMTYNLFDKISLQEIFEKDKSKPTKSLEHTFYDGGEKKSTIYKEKGVIKYVWNYDCKPEGELLNVKHKDLSTICIKEEIDPNGNRIVWNREFNQKGELTKTKTTFKSDSIWVRMDTYNQAGKLIKESFKTEQGSKTINYDKKGNVYSAFEFIYNGHKQMIKQAYKWKNTWNITLYHYTNDLKMSEVRVQKHSTFVDEYNYDFY